jgi:hypothetical protein
MKQDSQKLSPVLLFSLNSLLGVTVAAAEVWRCLAILRSVPSRETLLGAVTSIAGHPDLLLSFRA